MADIADQSRTELTATPLNGSLSMADDQPSGFQMPPLFTGLPGQGQTDGQTKLILGTFQAIVMPFNPNMIGSIIGANPAGGLPQAPALPSIGSG